MLDKGYFEDLIDQLEPVALAMDRTGDSSHVHLMFRTVHNLKGSVAQAGLSALSTEVHHLEDALDRIRRGREVWRTEHYDQVMEVIDRVRVAVNLPDRSDPEAVTASAAVPEPARTLPATAWGLALTPEEEGAVTAAVALGQGVYRLEKLFRKGLAEDVFNSLPVVEDLQEVGTLIAVRPPWAEYSVGPEEQVVKFLFASAQGLDQLTDVLFDPLMELQAPTGPAPMPRKEALRFLVIEDEATTGHLLQFILNRQGACDLLETGSEGMAAFRQALEEGRPYDLVMLDLFLPDMHGDQVLKQFHNLESQHGIRAPGDKCCVLINTASKDLDQMRQALEWEPDGYLIKPINMNLILEKIADLAAQRL
jgi:two-component system chemotaxis response regulator CheY